MPKTVLVTGANGFVGRSLCVRAGQMGWLIRRASRQDAEGNVTVGEIGPGTDWSLALNDIRAVVHLAARVHVMRDTAADPLAAFRQVNTEGTLNLARQAAVQGAKRFVYVSSIKVNGEETPAGQSFTEKDIPAPLDPYGISKMEAEHGLRALAAETGMELVIIRPPLVYGPGAKGNFQSMLHWLDRGIPLPLGAIHNQRSLIALDNLIDFIITCIDHPAAANQTFLVADGEDLSTPELLRRIARAMDKSARLIPVSVGVLKLAAALLGKQAVAQRLLGSLQVDISKARDLLGWTPPVTVDEGLRKTARAFLDAQRSHDNH